MSVKWQLGKQNSPCLKIFEGFLDIYYFQQDQKKLAKILGKNIFPKNIRNNKFTILTKNKLQRIAKNKFQIVKFVKTS